ncbi:MAG: transcription-repair coupling factor [Firmicutes bacterium]|nr:transcription-repair coupling factor [Bacillota bacterium]
MRGILKPLLSAPEFGTLARELDNNNRALVTGLSGTQAACVTAGLCEAAAPRPVLVVAAGEAEAGRLADDLSALLPGVPVRLFPVWQLLPYQVLAHGKEVLAQRLEVLDRLGKGERQVIVAPLEALMRRLVPPNVFYGSVLRLSAGDRVDLEGLLRALIAAGYERVDLVEERGQFALRGGIMDIFPMTQHRPVRVEFFDDEVDSIRRFDAATQRSEENAKEVFIAPAREFLFREEQLDAAKKAIEAEYKTQLERLSKAGGREAAGFLTDRFNEVVSGLGAGLSGIEQLLPFFYPEETTLIDYLPAGAPVFVDDPARLLEVAESIMRERTETFAALLSGGRVLPSQFRGYVEGNTLFQRIGTRPGAAFSLLPRQPRGFLNGRVINFPAKPMLSFMGNVEMLAGEIRQWKRNGYAVAILLGSGQRSKQLLDALRDYRVDAFHAGSLEGHVRPGNVVVTTANLQSGFELPSCRLAVVTEQEIYGQRKKARRERPRPDRLAPFVDLKVGDFVVHVNHGIGRYRGVVPLTIGGIRKEYLLLQYAGEDKLYVPVDQVGLVQKYLGGEGDAPRLSRLGGGEWARVKNRVKEAVREMARELLDLYAAREALPGYAFGPDTVWQKEFEEAFPYEETPDQLRAISEVKADMERPRPMDRLLCGDVGYGKTEVALRAAFKAVMDGKQVAVLVPTTILAQQHYNTFSERFAGYPVAVEMLSRFRSPKEQRQVIQGLEKGMIDIVIGTHRLVQEDVRFKDLGLLIVDEEQRFGVVHKERLKMLRKEVDVLTLSATPIPRTLHMSLVDIRDTSILETPPENRYPVQTYVLEEDPVLIREAIRRELNRGGQVFFVYNRVMDLDRVVLWLKGLVPGARIAAAHGQMKEDELEQVMLDFINGEYDVLACTTIIENGLDIPNVNTLIVKEANMMGLAQLYQLRGRVGRSNRLAYAYLTFRKDRVLNESAEKRLAAIREFTELGSGFKIAMRDLEIRGAGNILGAEQHGHIAAVGFDLYARLLEEAVREARGEAPPAAVETTVELPVEAYIPDRYVPDTDQKVEIYKRIAALGSLEELSELADEFMDRFGDPPEPVRNLLAVSRVRVLAGKLKARTVSLLPGQLRLLFAPGHPLTGEALVAAGREYPQRVKFNNAGEDFEIKLRPAGDGKTDGADILRQLEDFLAFLVDKTSGRAGEPAPGEAARSGGRAAGPDVIPLQGTQ